MHVQFRGLRDRLGPAALVEQVAVIIVDPAEDRKCTFTIAATDQSLMGENGLIAQIDDRLKSKGEIEVQIFTGLATLARAAGGE